MPALFVDLGNGGGTQIIVDRADQEWDPKKLALLEAERKQQNLFKDEKTLEEEFKVVQKLPYKFLYRIRDAKGKEFRMMIEDLEIGALYLNCLHRANGDEAIVVEKVREKYWNSFAKSGDYDLTLVLGTTLQHHNKRAPNPYRMSSSASCPHRMNRKCHCYNVGVYRLPFTAEC